MRSPSYHLYLPLPLYKNASCRWFRSDETIQLGSSVFAHRPCHKRNHKMFVNAMLHLFLIGDVVMEIITYACLTTPEHQMLVLSDVDDFLFDNSFCQFWLSTTTDCYFGILELLLILIAAWKWNPFAHRCPLFQSGCFFLSCQFEVPLKLFCNRKWFHKITQTWVKTGYKALYSFFCL